MHVSQKDIYIANLQPTEGSEQAGRRPVVIISGNTLNTHMPICIACPLSGVVKNFSTCVVIPKNKTTGLAKPSEVLTFQVRTLSQERLEKKLGAISDKQLNEIIQKLGRVLRY